MKRFNSSSLHCGEGNGTPLQYSCLESPVDGGAWWATVHGVGRVGLSDFTFAFHFHALEKAMAPHSSILAWRIPETEEPSGLPSMGSHRVGHDWSDLAAVCPPQPQAWTVCLYLALGLEAKVEKRRLSQGCEGLLISCALCVVFLPWC